MKFKKQITTLFPWIILIHGPIIGVLVTIEIQDAIPAKILLRDPNSLGKLPFYAGSVSNAGALLWVATAAICLFTRTLVKVRAANDRTSGFLLYAAVFTLVLMADDLFLLHEGLFRHYIPIDENIIYFSYALTAVLFLVLYRRIILDSEFILLVLALTLLGLSVGIDVIQHHIDDDQFLAIGGYVLEDGLKLLGIVTWLMYFSRYCETLIHASYSITSGGPS